MAKNTVVDENLVVAKSSEKTVDGNLIDENSVEAHFSGVDYMKPCTYLDPDIVL